MLYSLRMVRRLLLPFLLALGVLPSFFLTAQPVAAQTDVESGYQSILQNGLIFANMPECTATECPCRDSGQCSLDQVMQIFVNISTAILGIIGSIVLLMFVYGGVIWITSEGDASRVNQGKQTVVNAVIGLALVLGAYAIMTFVIASVIGAEPGQSLEETVDEATN